MPTITVRPVMLVLLFCFSLLSQAYSGADEPSWAGPLSYRADELHHITVGKLGFAYIAAIVNGQQHLDLVFDTANMGGLALNATVVSRLRLKSAGETPMYDTSGALLEKSHLYRVDSIAALGRGWREQRATELQQPEIEGLFGPHYLLGSRFTLDYQRQRIAVSDSPLPAHAPGETLPLLQSPAFPGMPVVEGTVNGRRVLIQIDTGKSRTCVDKELVRELHLPEAHYGYGLAEVSIGSWKFSVQSARKEDFSGISKGFPLPILVGIGSDVLPQVIMTVDYRTRRLNLIPARPPRNAAAPAS